MGRTPGRPNSTRYNLTLGGNLAQLPHVVPVGAAVTAFPRGGQHSLVMMNTSTCHITNVTLWGGSSMGVVEANGAGSNVFTRLRMLRRQVTARLVGSVA